MMSSLQALTQWQVIDCQYQFPQFAAAFLKTKNGRSVFIENNTTQAIPYLLSALKERGGKPEAVDYLIVTHAHLDHSGATGALMRLFPTARLVAHPKTARTLNDPSRLVQSAEQVYGKEAFQKLYGKIEPVPKERTLVVQDNESLSWEGETFQFLFTEGHASHHMCVLLPESEIVFTGDSFGLCYPALRGSRPFHFPSTSPVDFDFHAAVQSIDRIVATGCSGAFLTHFGWIEELALRGEMLKQHLKYHQSLIEECEKEEVPDEELESRIFSRLSEYFKQQLRVAGIPYSAETENLLKMDIQLNAAGLAVACKKKRKPRP